MGLAGKVAFLKAKSSNLYRYLEDEYNRNFVINNVAVIIHAKVADDMAEVLRICS
jgi:hypothetical protein